MSHIGHLLRHYGKPVGGVALAVASLAAAVTGRTVNGVVFDTVSPLVAAALAAVIGSTALALYVERRTLVRIARALLLRDEEARTPLRDLVRRARGIERPMWWAIGAMALGVAGMLPLTLLALERLGSMGTVGAVVFCGPLALAVWGLWTLSRRGRLSGMFWMGVAATGVACLTRFWEGQFSWTGLLFAYGAAAAYMLFLAMYGRMREIDKDGLPMGVALANLLAATVTVTLTAVALWLLGDTFVQGISNPSENWLNWRVVGIAGLAGLLSGTATQIGQSQIFAKGLIGLATYSVLTALEPSFSFLLGWALLGDEPDALAWLGTVLVCTAGLACLYQLEFRGPRRAAVAPGGDGD